MHRISLKWHLVEGPITFDFTLHLKVHDHTTWFWRCIGTAFGHFILDSHNVMVVALGLCVNWPSFTTSFARFLKPCMFYILQVFILHNILSYDKEKIRMLTHDITIQISHMYLHVGVSMFYI